MHLHDPLPRLPMIPLPPAMCAAVFAVLTAGDAIDTTFSSTFHISTLAAAGFGNLVSDVAGLGLSSSIENAATSLGTAVCSPQTCGRRVA